MKVIQCIWPLWSKLDRECCYTLKATKNGYFAGIIPQNDEDENPICTRGKDESETIVENLYLMPVNVDITAIDDPRSPVDRRA